jgi:predicted MPP superfamily phosphohydrolase
VREWLAGIVAPVYLSKIAALTVVAMDDVRRVWHWVKRRFRKTEELRQEQPWGEGLPGDSPTDISEEKPGDTAKISRSVFLNKLAVVGGAMPMAAFSYGILGGAHDYRVIRRTIRLKNLPHSLNGIRIGQFSDIHTGTLFNKTAIQGGIDLLLAEKPDLIFFTGDLVNYYAREAKPYVPLFSNVKAPLGVYAVTGNHDYGDYNWWPSPQARQHDIDLIRTAYREMGYDLLLNDHRLVKVGGESLAVIGVENWSFRRPQKYGDLQKAIQGTDQAPVRLLLSHDPSHWDHVVRPDYPQIDVTFAGHTHGFQCGVEVGDWRWSPAQYRFTHWADLYQQGQQYLYVNRGFGCIAYPGRIGMPPELTVITLERG